MCNSFHSRYTTVHSPLVGVLHNVHSRQCRVSKCSNTYSWAKHAVNLIISLKGSNFADVHVVILVSVTLFAGRIFYAFSFCYSKTVYTETVLCCTVFRGLSRLCRLAQDNNNVPTDVVVVVAVIPPTLGAGCCAFRR